MYRGLSKAGKMENGNSDAKNTLGKQSRVPDFTCYPHGSREKSAIKCKHLCSIKELCSTVLVRGVGLLIGSVKCQNCIASDMLMVC